MKADVRRRLDAIASAAAADYGKLVQKLLAIAFCKAGVRRLTDRSTQGIDLEVELADGRRVALEVKTSQSGEVTLGRKDVRGLQARAAEGYVPYFALLGPRLIDDWVFARYADGEIRADSTYKITRLRAYRDRDLEAVVRETFPGVVVAHANAAATGGQAALDEVLERYESYNVA